MALILIIDDDAEGAVALAGLLRRRGHEAEYVTNVPAGMARLRQTTPNLVVLDIGMPDFTGLEMLAAIGEDSRYEELRIVAMSGIKDPQTRTDALRLGASDFISKTLSLSEICAKIEGHLDETPQPK